MIDATGVLVLVASTWTGSVSVSGSVTVASAVATVVICSICLSCMVVDVVDWSGGGECGAAA